MTIPKANILLVDDRPENLLALEVALASLNENLVLANSGEEALKCLLQQQFSVVLLDVQMPGMDGFELAQLMRAREQSKHTPIIFITAIGPNDIFVSKVSSLDAVDYLFKPVVLEILRSKVHVFVDLFKLHHELKQKAAELARSNKELERTNRDLDEFAYVASHDLRSPLEGIKNLAKWIAEDNADTLPDKSKRHLEQMQQRLERLEQLLDDLRQYSRAGRVHGAIVEVDTAELVRETFEVLNPPDGFRISVSDLPTLRTIRTPLEQVLRNLINNAVKHHDHDKGTIEVTCRDADEQYEFSVTDDGPGIPAEFHEQIFKLFETLRPRDEVEGSGMGLAVIKKTVESFGGSVTVESTDGRGTTFRFTWPKTMENW